MGASRPKAFIVRVNGSFLRQIKMVDVNNSKRDVTELYDNSGSEERKEVPAGHRVIGVYGRMEEGYRITSLGFITVIDPDLQ